MPGQMEYKVEESTGKISVKLIGEVDIYTSQELKEGLYEVVETNRADLHIDCSELEYIDSSGLGVLIGVLKKTKSYGKDVHLVNVRDSIRRLLSITCLDKVFIIE